jgi:hypothetical protein
MNVGRFSIRLAGSILSVVALAGMGPSGALAQDGHAHPQGKQPVTAQQKASANGLVKVVRKATERFKDSAVAAAEGYALQFGCVSGEDTGAMGLHYVNFALVKDVELDPTRPEIVIYEPTADGGVNLIGADFLVFADAWDAAHEAPPQLMGQLLHRIAAPNRYGLPSFYTLHVWAWKDNPTGTFANWHTRVSCDAFSGQKP